MLEHFECCGMWFSFGLARIIFILPNIVVASTIYLHAIDRVSHEEMLSRDHRNKIEKNEMNGNETWKN